MASKRGIVLLPLLSLVLPAVSQSIPGASFFKGGGIPDSGAYELVDDYEPSVFFSKFNFYNVCYLHDNRFAMRLKFSSHMIRHMAMFSKYNLFNCRAFADLRPQIRERIGGRHKWLRDYQQ